MPPKPPQYGSPLLAILRGGKDSVTPKPPQVSWGLPNAPTPPSIALPQTANATRQLIQPTSVNQQMPVQQPKLVNPMDILKQGKEQVISQAPARGLVRGAMQDFGGALKNIASGDLSPLGSPTNVAKGVGKFAFNLPNYIMAAFVGTGRSIMEETLPRVFSNVTRESLRKDFDSAKGIDEWLLKGEVDSWQEIKQKLQTAVDESPNAKEWEKKYLPVSVAVAGFALDASGFGKPANKIVTKTLLEQAAKDTNTHTVRNALIKAGVPQEVAEIATPMVVRATTPEQVQNALVRASEDVLNRIPANTDVAKEVIIKRFDFDPTQPVGFLPDDVRDRYVQFLKKTKNPTVEDINRGLELLLLDGRQVDDIAKMMASPTNFPKPRLGAMDIKPARVVNSVTATKTPTQYSGIRSQGGYAMNPFAVTNKGVKATTPRVANSGDAAAFNRAANGLLRDSWTKLREVVQDSWIRAKNLQRTPGVKVEKGANPYLAETLFHGRVHTRLQEVKNTVIKIDKDIVNTAKALNIKSDELTATINKYLQAKHAPERNAKLGDGAAGITTKEAEDFIARTDASSLGREVKRVTDELLELNRRTLTTLKQAQVIDDETFKTLTETYKNHVPLNRILDTTEEITEALTGRGFSVKGSGIKRAVGSQREVADIIANITTNVEQAIIRAEKNLVNLQTLKFARNNPQLGLFEEIKPKVLGLDFQGKPIMQQVNDPQILSLRENGKPVYLKINDPHLAAMYQNVNLEHVPNMMQWIAIFTRLYSSLHTRFNYEFAFSNKVRDIQEMAIDMASRKEMGFKQVGKAVAREPQSIKDVTDFIRGKDTEGARLYKQMQEDGGTTGGLSLSTRKQIEIDIEKIRQLNRSQPRRAARMLLEAVDNWNTIFEDSTRLSVYKQALKNGSDRETAAMLAKESTVNFNKKGTGGSIINSLYMFSNASIQGTTKMLRAMKNPKVAGAVVGTMGLSVYNLNKFNDEVDPEWRSKVTEFDRTSNFVIFLPSKTGEAKYVTIPVSWGLKPIKVAAEHANDLMTGHNNSVPDAVRGILIAVATAYNPLAGSESVVETLTPTFLKTPQEITSNIAWHGGKIRPDYDPNMPKSAQYFKSLENKATGRVAIFATEKIADATKGEIEISPANINYAFEAYIGGLGRSVTKILNTITSIGKGEELKASEIPVASRFFKVRDTEQTETQRIYNILDEQRKKRSESVYTADRTFRDLKKLPKDQLKLEMTRIAKENPKLFDQLKTRFIKDKWTPQEKALASLTNARKAEYLLAKLPEMTPEERRVYVKNLLDKGVISQNVITEMRNQRGIIEQ